jgi:hypothetical protein
MGPQRHECKVEIRNTKDDPGAPYNDRQKLSAETNRKILLGTQTPTERAPNGNI